MINSTLSFLSLFEQAFAIKHYWRMQRVSQCSRATSEMQRSAQSDPFVFGAWKSRSGRWLV